MNEEDGGEEPERPDRRLQAACTRILRGTRREGETMAHARLAGIQFELTTTRIARNTRKSLWVYA